MRNLILFNKELEVKYLLDLCTHELKGNVYNEDLYYIEVKEELFFKLVKVIGKNIIKFIENPLKAKKEVTEHNITITPIPEVIKPTPTTILAKAFLEEEVRVKKLENKTVGLASGMIESVLSEVELKKQIKLLSKAILEMNMKNI